MSWKLQSTHASCVCLCGCVCLCKWLSTCCWIRMSHFYPTTKTIYYGTHTRYIYTHTQPKGLPTFAIKNEIFVWAFNIQIHLQADCCCFHHLFGSKSNSCTLHTSVCNRVGDQKHFISSEWPLHPGFNTGCNLCCFLSLSNKEYQKYQNKNKLLEASYDNAWWPIDSMEYSIQKHHYP